MPFEGTTSFSRLDDGLFLERSVLCAPDQICTGENVFVLPATCVRARDPSKGCMSTQRNGCAGRSSLDECPDDNFCFFPDNEQTQSESQSESSDEKASGDAPGNTRMTRTKLEQCGTIMTSFNGPNFSITMANGGQPNDANMGAGGDIKSTKKNAMLHGPSFAPKVQKMLKTLWPFPVCGGADSSDSSCTQFPLPVPARDDDGGIIPGKCLEFDHKDRQTVVDCDSLDSPVDMSFLYPGSTHGATDYHCTWAMLHTLAFNGGTVLSIDEKSAMDGLIFYLSGQFGCKVCRNNFVNIIEHFGLPSGYIRADYAKWFWRAHNNANEHSYATHSLDLKQVSSLLKESGLTDVDPFTMTRTDEWANPIYEHDWYMPFEDAERVWMDVLVYD